LNQNSVIDHGSELFGDNTTKQDGELEINNANFTISAVLENTNIFAFDSYKSHNEMNFLKFLI
jgi:hypothetical protein